LRSPSSVPLQATIALEAHSKSVSIPHLPVRPKQAQCSHKQRSPFIFPLRNPPGVAPAFHTQTLALPVHLVLVPFLVFHQYTAMPTALVNHKIAFTKSTQTALFIRLIPPFPSGFSWIYMLPNRPKSAIQRINKIVSQTKMNGMRWTKGTR